MSTKTTFKRIALVAVAALGLGVISIAPSSAAISGLTLTVNNAGAHTLRAGETTKIDADTNTAASFTVTALHTSQSDTTTVAFYLKSKPALAASEKAFMSVSDTTTAATRISLGDRAAGSFANLTFNKYSTFVPLTDSVTAGAPMRMVAGFTAGAIGNVGGTFSLNLDTNTAGVKGTYVYTVIATTYSNNGSDVYTVSSTSSDVSIVVSANAADATTNSVVPSAAYSTAYIGAGATVATSDTTISAEATAVNTARATITVTLKNASQTTGVAQDSVTATITGPGTVCNSDGTVCGKTLSNIAVAAGTLTLTVRADGTAGSSTVALTTKSGITFAPKSINFYAKAAKTITASVKTPVLVVGANTSAISVAAVDATGVTWTGAAYIVASSAADALVAGSTTPEACTAWNSTDGILCPLTAIAEGTAKFKIIDASTVALATATSNEVTVTVSAQPAATVKIAFDKATYAPFEKATIIVTPLDAKGAGLGATTLANLFATGGITSNYAFSTGSDTLTAVSVTTKATSSSTTGAVAGSAIYTVYMPASGDITLTAKGGTSLPAAGQVAVTASASVVNSSVDAATDAANEATDAANAATDAALAAADAADAATAAAQDASDAVAALSATVAKLVASLKAQITSLTNLVIKIQKKVKA